MSSAIASWFSTPGTQNFTSKIPVQNTLKQYWRCFWPSHIAFLATYYLLYKKIHLPLTAEAAKESDYVKQRDALLGIDSVEAGFWDRSKDRREVVKNYQKQRKEAQRRQMAEH